MERLISKNLTLKYALLGLFAFITIFVASLLVSHPANAATYTYSSDGKVVVNHNGSNYTLSKQIMQSGGKDDYRGTVKVNGPNGSPCMLGIQVLASPSATSGTVAAPAFLNGGSGADNSGSAVTPSCPSSFAPSQAEFNKSITIGTGGGAAPGNPETSSDRQVNVTVYSPVQNPPNASVTVKVNGTSVGSKSISWSGSSASLLWGDIDANDKVEACLNPVSPFDTTGCKSGTKERGKQLVLAFGSSSNAYNPEGKQVNVDVNLNVPASAASSKYGPISLTIYSIASGTAAGTTDTNDHEFGSAEQGTVAQKYTLKGTFENIEAGQYKVCVTSNTDLCSATFTKEANRSVKAAIDVNEENTRKLAQGTGTSCGIEGIGWIVCPVLSFTGSITDAAFDFLSTTFLETKVSILQDQTVRAAWSTIRTIANIAFVIAFLIIIFSQLTGTGVSNYGVKKMLPRLIIAAILVNLSYYVCLIAVDLSNIIGYSLNDLLKSSYAQIQSDVAGDASNNALGIAAIVAGVIAGTVTLALAVTIPVLVAAILALVLIVLILVARTALIILLTIIAPLAFVAFLFPNTQQWFKKWYKTFLGLLLVFPIIAAVFGASTLAAKVINDAANGDWMMQIVAVGVATLPLFVVPSLLKGSLNAAGTIGTKLSGISSKLNGKIGAQVKDTSKLGQYQQYRGQQAKIRRAQILGGSYKGSNKNPLNWGRNLSSQVNNQLNQRGGKFGTEQSRLGERINAKIEAEEVTAAKATIDKMGLTMEQTAALARGESIVLREKDANGNEIENGKIIKRIKSDVATQKYAISSIIQTGDHDATRDLIDTVGNGKDTALRVHLADSLASSSSRPGYVGGVALGAIKSGTGVSSVELAKSAIESGAYSPDKLARGDKDELTFVAQIANENSARNIVGTPEYSEAWTIAHQRLLNDTSIAQTDPELSVLTGKNRGALNQMRTNNPPERKNKDKDVKLPPKEPATPPPTPTP